MPLEIVRTTSELTQRVRAARLAGRRIGVVPTMGYLHEGHLRLVAQARAACDLVIITIFVNPTQFGPNEDLAKYPRDEAGDVAKAATAGADLAFCPEPSQMYPAGAQTFVDVRELSQPLCGARRPGHFIGVATVVAKLLLLTQAHVAYFGEKDYQQLAVIRRMVSDLFIDVEVVGVPIVREPDGLAMSSRNVYLNPDERAAAVGLSQGLFAAQRAYAAGERRHTHLLEVARATLRSPLLEVDYLELRDAETLAPCPATLDEPAVLALAVFVGTAPKRTRLIDNLHLAATASPSSRL